MLDLAFKDLKIFVRDKKALFLTFLLPIALITLFGLAYGGLGDAKPKAEILLISDMDSTARSAELVKEISRMSGIILAPTDTAQGGSLIRQGRRLAMLTIPNGYSDSLEAGKMAGLDLLFDAGREIETGMLLEALSGFVVPQMERFRTQQGIREFLQLRYAAMGEGFADNLSKEIGTFMQSSQADNPVIQPRGISGQKSVNWGLIQAVAGVAVMMLLFSVTTIGGSILTEKESGTLRRLLISPIHPALIILGKLLFALIVAFAQLMVMFLFGWLVFGLEIWNNPLSLLIVILATALACSSFGVFLASISRSRRQVEGMSTIIILIMSAIGGSMIPLFFMPAFMQKIAVFSVNYWSIQAFYDILGRDTPLLQMIWKPGILFGIAVTLSFISMYFFRRNILKET